MPVWLYPIIKLAIQIGSPYLIKLLKGWVSKYPLIVEILDKVSKGILDPDTDTKEAKQEAHRELREVHKGVGSPPETKGL